MEEEKEYLEYLKEEKKRKKHKILLIVGFSIAGILLLVLGYLWIDTPMVRYTDDGKPIIIVYPSEEVVASWVN